MHFNVHDSHLNASVHNITSIKLRRKAMIKKLPLMRSLGNERRNAGISTRFARKFYAECYVKS